MPSLCLVWVCLVWLGLVWLGLSWLGFELAWFRVYFGVVVVVGVVIDVVVGVYVGSYFGFVFVRFAADLCVGLSKSARCAGAAKGPTFGSALVVDGCYLCSCARVRACESRVLAGWQVSSGVWT